MQGHDDHRRRRFGGGGQQGRRRRPDHAHLDRRRRVAGVPRRAELPGVAALPDKTSGSERSRGRRSPGTRSYESGAGRTRSSRDRSESGETPYAAATHRRQLEDVQDGARDRRLRQGAARAGEGRRAASRSWSRRRSPRCTPRPRPRAAATSPIAAQNLHWEREGAFTGEVSAAMLREAGAEYVIIGHSERRDALRRDRPHRQPQDCARRSARGLMPIVCVGETLEQRDGEPDAGRRSISSCSGGLDGVIGRAAGGAGARLRAGVGDRHRPQRHARAGAGGACAHPDAAAAVVRGRRGGALPRPLRRQREAGQHRRADRAARRRRRAGRRRQPRRGRRSPRS